MTDLPNPYWDERKPSPGETQVKHGSWFLSFLRIFFKMTKKEEAAAEVIGAMLSREITKWRT